MQCPPAVPSLLATALAAAAASAGAEPALFERPNPWLASSTYPITHVGSGQQGAVAVAGPTGPSRVLEDADVAYLFTGPGHLIQAISGPYPDGRRAIWSAGVDGVVKQDYASFAAIDAIAWNGDEADTPSAAEARERAIEGASGPLAVWRATREMMRLRAAGGLYPLVDRDGLFYAIHGDAIEVYGDVVAGDAGSRIEAKRRFPRPADASGRFVGMNFSYDGWLLAVTEGGDLFALSRDFSQQQRARLEGAPPTAEDSGGNLEGWVRNSFAVGQDGDVYVVSRDFMHRVQWTGQGFSQAEAEGAWREPYPNSAGNGSGATPSLMGFGDGDRFVVITDGDVKMNLVLFWRDAIPSDWKGLPGLPRRIAASAPATMGDPSLAAVQSEQSVCVMGYGALIVNNEPARVPWYLPKRMGGVLVGLLATDPAYTPHGVQKFAWDPKMRTLAEAWVNRELSSPNAVPMASAGSGLVYTQGVRDGKWTLEALDWETGASRFHWVLPRLRYSTMFAPVALDPDGRVLYGAPWGRVRLQPRDGVPR